MRRAPVGRRDARLAGGRPGHRPMRSGPIDHMGRRCLSGARSPPAPHQAQQAFFPAAGGEEEKEKIRPLDAVRAGVIQSADLSTPTEEPRSAQTLGFKETGGDPPVLTWLEGAVPFLHDVPAVFFEVCQPGREPDLHKRVAPSADTLRGQCNQRAHDHEARKWRQ